MTKSKNSQDFAAKMKRLREKEKIPLEVLAKITGLKPTYLERIESGEIRPTVSSIIQISNALEVDSGTFLSAENSLKSSRKLSFQKREEAYFYKTLTPKADTKHMKAFQVTIAPESDHEGVDYKHKGEEFIYVLEGQLNIQVGQQKHRLKKGETIHFESGHIHRLSNPGKKKTELIVVIYTP
jgi:quercetin dioxygenase-like cupin family protein